MALLLEGDLTPVERRLCQAAADGLPLDLRSDRAEENDPEQGEDWTPGRQVRAQVLYQLLAGRGKFDEAFGTPAAVATKGALIVGRLELTGVTLRCAVALVECRLAGLVLTRSRAVDISLRGSHLASAMARRMQLEHDLDLTELDCRGGVMLSGAHIGGQLSCTGAKLTNLTGPALHGDRLTVDGDLFLRDGTEITGGMRLLGAHIGGQLDCGKAKLTNLTGPALHGDRLTVDGSLFLRDGTEITGGTRLLGARIGGQLDCGKAKLTNPTGPALHGDRLTVDGDLFLRDGTEITGETRLLGAHIGGQLNCEGATLTNPNGLALDLERVVVDGDVLMRPAGLQGGIDLTHARVAGWADDPGTWPNVLHLAGFSYEDIEQRRVSVKQRLRWIGRHEGGYIPQPYEQLAAVYRRAGHDQAARTVLVAKQRARYANPTRWWVRSPRRAWSLALRWTIGYGYRPIRVLPWLACLAVLGSFVLDHAHHTRPSHFTPAKAGPGQAEFNAVRYTLDLLLPVANLKQRDAFIPHGYASWWVFGLTLSGWLLALVLVAGLTGVFKRD